MVSKPLYEVSTMKQFNKLIEFRQAIYDHGLTLVEGRTAPRGALKRPAGTPNLL